MALDQYHNHLAFLLVLTLTSKTMKKIICLLAICSLLGCVKKLELKPDSTLVLPVTIQDFENLLDNTQVMNNTVGIKYASSDEYRVKTLAIFESLPRPLMKSAYIWQSNLFNGLAQVEDWTIPYKQIFICNSVLDVLAKQNISIDTDKNRIKGWALFARAYAFYNLVSIFSKGYDSGTALNDLGIPLKLNSSVSEIVQRSSLEETYNQIISDALQASELLQQDIPLDNKNRPSKIAAFAFLARVCLSMRKYDRAEFYADKSIALYATLIDYKSLPVYLKQSSFSINSEETIYFSQDQSPIYGTMWNGTSTTVDEELIKLYSQNDTRLAVYYRLATNGNYITKGINSISNSPFTGLATDEMYLIKAECLARQGLTSSSMDVLNQLLIKRWDPNATNPVKAYEKLIAATPEIALNNILLERRKALVNRGLRWTDLKRLNLEGRNIVLTRKLGDKIYTLEPNSPRYVMPIPDDELALSGIQQNIR